MSSEDETASELLLTVNDSAGTDIDADQDTQREGTDDDTVIFIVEGENVSSSRSLLCYASPVLREMLTNKNSAKTKQIPLPGIKIKAFKDFLECIDPLKLTRVTRDTVYGVLTLAHEYKMIILKKTCEDTLLQKVASAENSVSANNKFIFYHMQLAEQYQLCRLTTYCINLASEMTQTERETAAGSHAVSQAAVTKILTRAVRKLELSNSDENYAANETRSNTKVTTNYIGEDKLIIHTDTDVIDNLMKPRSTKLKLRNERLTYTETKERAFQRHLRALRLAYKYKKSMDVKKKIVLQIREEQKDPEWKTMVEDEFDLLNESIKNDIEGRMVPIF